MGLGRNEEDDTNWMMLFCKLGGVAEMRYLRLALEDLEGSLWVILCRRRTTTPQHTQVAIRSHFFDLGSSLRSDHAKRKADEEATRDEPATTQKLLLVMASSAG